jgi:predicted N-formylglutamate amidohydrolase
MGEIPIATAPPTNAAGAKGAHRRPGAGMGVKVLPFAIRAGLERRQRRSYHELTSFRDQFSSGAFMREPQPLQAGSATKSDSIELLEGDLDGGLVILVDHASNFIPPEYGDLGLPPAELARHIAYDIGAGPLGRILSERFHAPALLTRFSRLLIDPNRGEDDPTLVMRLSDGAVVPGNARIGSAETERRLDRFYRPYHVAVERLLNRMVAAGRPPAILAIHSYTPVWKGERRPWHAGVLWDRDPRFAKPLLEGLRAEHGLRVGDNEPYDGSLKNDTLYRHGTVRGLAHVLLEVRNDLIATPAGVLEWADRLEPILRDILKDRALYQIRHFGSLADADSPQHGENDATSGPTYAYGT